MKDLSAYQAASSGVVYFHQKNTGFLRLSGADRVDFIQRQTTNDLRNLTLNQSVMTVLTSPIAHILDVLCVIDEGETLGLIPLPRRLEETTKFLRSRIFFSDQVKITDVSSNFEQVLVFGSQATRVLENFGVHSPQLNQVSTVNLNAHPVIVIVQKIFSEISFLFLVARPSMNSVLSVLAQAGAKSVDSETFEILRVESGQPGPSGELTEDYTPLEIGYQEMISGSKGCYTGQEIIARQITYDKITKKLVGIRLDRYAAVGSSLSVDGKSAGTLTSVVHSPRFGVIGLGVVRQQVSQTGTKLKLTSSTDDGILAEIAKLPFT